MTTQSSLIKSELTVVASQVRKDFWQCMRGWMRQERLGETEQLRKECIGEEGYAKVSRKVIAEQKIVEKDRNPLESEISGWY